MKNLDRGSLERALVELGRAALAEGVDLDPDEVITPANRVTLEALIEEARNE